VIDYKEFIRSHEEYYASAIQYQVRYDEATLFESIDYMAGRIWITTSRPNEKPKELEVILIIQFREKKIYRLWELTYPDWSNLPAFKEE
jgi:hypothetical protein